MIYYHNPKCSKSRQGLALLQEQGLDFEIRLYLNVPLSSEELQLLLKNHQRSDLIRKKEATQLGISLDLDDERLIQAIISHPRILQRPLLVNGTQSVIGRPPEKLLEIAA